ncbi:hypothetical protein Tco_1478832 [Tanacetum coccineum]
MQCNTATDDYPFNAGFEMPTSTDAMPEYTPPLEEAASLVYKRSSSITPLSHASVERCEVPTASAKNVGLVEI